MPNNNRNYLNVSGDADKLDLMIDPQEFDKTIDEDRLGTVYEFIGDPNDPGIPGLSNATLALLNLDRAQLKDEADTLNARILSYGWPNHQITFTARHGDWLSPDSIVPLSFCGESGANVASNSIDEDFGTHWRHALTERHSITYQLRGFPLRVEDVRFRFAAARPANEQLINVDIYMAKALINIDDVSNRVLTAANPTWPDPGDVWVTVPLDDAKASAVFIKVEFDTAVGPGQIREFEVFCTPKKAG